MKRTSLLLPLALVACRDSSPQKPASSEAPAKVATTPEQKVPSEVPAPGAAKENGPEKLTLQSKILGEERAFLVRTPRGYEQGSDKYPVLYMTDGDRNIGHTAATVQFLADNGRMPEMIIVGISNTDRTRDLTPSRASLNEPARRSRSRPAAAPTSSSTSSRRSSSRWSSRSTGSSPTGCSPATRSAACSRSTPSRPGRSCSTPTSRSPVAPVGQGDGGEEERRAGQAAAGAGPQPLRRARQRAGRPDGRLQAAAAGARQEQGEGLRVHLRPHDGRGPRLDRHARPRPRPAQGVRRLAAAARARTARSPAAWPGPRSTTRPCRSGSATR